MIETPDFLAVARKKLFLLDFVLGPRACSIFLGIGSEQDHPDFRFFSGMVGNTWVTKCFPHKNFLALAFFFLTSGVTR